MHFPQRDGHTAYWAGWDSLPSESNPYEHDAAWAWKWQEGRADHQRERQTAQHYANEDMARTGTPI